MPQLESILVTALNALIVSGKWNECSRASATSNCFCASALHVVLNCTLPSFGPRGPAASSWASALETANAKSDATATAVPVGFMTPPRAKDSAASLPPLVWENPPSHDRPHPLCAEPHRLPPHRRCAHRAFLLGLCPSPRRPVHSAHRGHRPRALHRRVGAGDPRRHALARPRLGRGAVLPD